MELLRSLYDWVVAWAYTPYAGVALFGIAFAESSFFPIPPDVLMIPLAISRPPIALLFAALATVASVLGGVFGYVIGKLGGQPVLHRLFSEEKIRAVRHYYHKYDVWAIGIAGFTPIPYKLFTISAGVFDLDFKRFMLASLVGRGGRFFLVGGLIMIFGEAIQGFIDEYFDLLAIAFTLLLIGGFYVINVAGKRAKSPVKGAQAEQ
ncbi:MAG: YqaA family protein [Ardenticatenia bacterium]|nr:YqaA family protein [Ardenticatenia bacterium]